MVRVSVLNDALKSMYREEGETAGHDQAFSESDYHVSFGYAEAIGEFEFVDDQRSGKIVVELNCRLNKCGVISL